MQDASLSQRTAGFLTRGQTPSSDSQASINWQEERRGHGLCAPVVVRGKDREAQLCCAGKVHLQEAQTENEKRSWVNEWVD